MKKLFLLLAITLHFAFALAQEKSSGNPLENTDWKGMANIPSSEEVVLNFSNKEMNLSYLGNVVEKMGYHLSDNQSIIFKKIDGNSPCTSDQFGIYKYKIENNKLYLTVIIEDCTARKKAFDPKGYDKVAVKK